MEKKQTYTIEELETALEQAKKAKENAKHEMEECFNSAKQYHEKAVEHLLKEQTLKYEEMKNYQNLDLAFLDFYQTQMLLAEKREKEIKDIIRIEKNFNKKKEK